MISNAPDILAADPSSKTIYVLNDGKIENTITLQAAEELLFENIMHRHMVIMRQNKATAVALGSEILKEELVEGWERPIREYNYSAGDMTINHSTLGKDILRAMCKHVISVIQTVQENGLDAGPFPSMKSVLDGTSSSAYPKLNIDAFEVANPIKKAAECGVIEALVRHVKHPEFIESEEKLLSTFGNFEQSLSEGWKKKQTTSEEKKLRSFGEDLPKLRTFHNAMIHCDIMTGKPVDRDGTPRRDGLAATPSNSSGQRIVERIKEYVLTVMRHSRKGLSNGGNRNVASDCRSEMIRQHFQFVKRKGNGQKKEIEGAAQALLQPDNVDPNFFASLPLPEQGPPQVKAQQGRAPRDRRPDRPNRRKEESSSQLKAITDREDTENAISLLGKYLSTYVPSVLLPPGGTTVLYPTNDIPT